MKQLKWKLLVFISAVCVMLILQGCNSNSAAEGKKYPDKTIEMVVGWGAGGGTDTFARAIAKEMSDILGVNINVVNKPGASGAIAGDDVAKKPADGYTIWAISSNYPINVALDKTPHDLSQYTPIGRVQKDTMAIQVQKGSKYADVDTLIAEAKANPGAITVGGTGSLSFDEIIVRQFEEAAGIKLNYVPYESAGEMHAAVLGGHIDLMVDEIGPTISQIEAGQVELALVFTEERLADFPDVAVSVEFGWDVTDGQARGLLVHKDTPQEIVEILVNALEQAKDREAYKKYEEESYLHLRNGWLKSEDFRKDLESNVSIYTEVVQKLDQ